MQEPAGLAGAVAPAIGAQPPFHWSQQHQDPARPQRRTKAVGGAPLGVLVSLRGVLVPVLPGGPGSSACPPVGVAYWGDGRQGAGGGLQVAGAACSCLRPTIAHCPRRMPHSKHGASSRPQRCAGWVVSRDPQVAPPQLDVPAGVSRAGRQARDTCRPALPSPHPWHRADWCPPSPRRSWRAASTCRPSRRAATSGKCHAHPFVSVPPPACRPACLHVAVVSAGS